MKSPTTHFQRSKLFHRKMRRCFRKLLSSKNKQSKLSKVWQNPIYCNGWMDINRKLWMHDGISLRVSLMVGLKILGVNIMVKAMLIQLHPVTTSMAIGKILYGQKFLPTKMQKALQRNTLPNPLFRERTNDKKGKS